MCETNPRNNKMHLFGHHDIPKHGASHAHVHSHIRVVVMGAAAVGKTTIIKQCLFHEFTTEYKETIEDTFNYNGHHFDMEVLDTSGSHNFPDMMKIAIREGDIFVLVFSVGDYSTFDRLTQIRKDIQDIKGPEAAMIIVGNKTDLEDREVPNSIADAVVSIDWNCSYHEVSAKHDGEVSSIFSDVLNHFPALYGEKIVCVNDTSQSTIMRHSYKEKSRKRGLSSLMKFIPR